MNRRNIQQRRHDIVSMINELGEVQVDALAARFAASEVTIRKDLAELEKNGLLLRRYGGAVALPSELTTSETPSRLKQAVADKASTLIRDHNRIIIDSGSTTRGIIAGLNNKTGLIVMTNSLKLAGAIHELENEPTLLMTGGTWDPHSGSFQGQVAEQVLRSYDFDQLFIGADGIDLRRGTTTFNELTGLSKVMAEVSRQVIVVMESEKLGRRIPNLELAWDTIDILVTDSHIAAEAVTRIERQGVRVLTASSD